MKLKNFVQLCSARHQKVCLPHFPTTGNVGGQAFLVGEGQKLTKSYIYIAIVFENGDDQLNNVFVLSTYHTKRTNLKLLPAKVGFPARQLYKGHFAVQSLSLPNT